MTPPRSGRPPDEERGPVDWGEPRASAPGPAAPGAPARGAAARGGADSTSSSKRFTATGAAARGGAGVAGAPVAGARTGPDWGVGRGPAAPAPTPGQRARTPWPVAVRKQRLSGVAFALVGLALATWSAMNLATAAGEGHPWVPPWLVVVLGGAGLVSAAGYLAWAGGSPLRREEERWSPRPIDAAAGLTASRVAFPAGAPVAGLLGPGTGGAAGAAGAPGVAAGIAADTAGAPVEMDPGPAPIMGSSTFDQSSHAPAGVAGAVGGFMLAGAVVCAVIALVLGPPWLLGTGGLAVGGAMAVHLAGDWLGHP